MNRYLILLILTLVIFLLLEIQAFNHESHYIYDIPMCASLMVLMYFIRSHIHLNLFHYLLFASFLILHCMGLYDAYLTYPLGIEYDYWLHGYFGFIACLIILRWMTVYLHNSVYYIPLIFTLFFVLGMSCLHELYEFFGALLLGQGEGVLFIGAGDLDQWDTQKDMLNNLIGALLAILFSYFLKVKQSPKS